MSRTAQALALGLIALVVALGQISVRPDWHASYHAIIDSAHNQSACDTEASEPLDEHGQDANCAVDSFAQGTLLLEVAQSLTEVAVLESQELVLPPYRQALRHDSFREPPGRAPPFFIV